MHIDKLIRSRRKTVALQVTDAAEVIVRAPRWVSRSFIDTFVSRHNTWIEEQKKKSQKRLRYVRTYQDGEVFLYLGTTLYLTRRAKTKKVHRIDNLLHIPCNQQSPSVNIEAWYKKNAKAYITERVEYLARQNGFRVRKIRITSARSRWGSCSGKGNLNFTWRLIMAPEEVIDYVIFHELVHLRHMDHSRTFWALVEQLCPDHKVRQKWLHVHGSRLTV